MIAILMTPTEDPAELGREFDRWIAHYHEPPSIVLGHRLLIYALARDPYLTHRDDQDFYRGVLLLCLVELWDANWEQFGERDSE